MKRLPFILLILFAGSFIAFKSGIARATPPPGKYEQIMIMVGKILSEGHFSPQPIDDNFSKKVFNEFIDDLDPERNIFLKNDFDSLFQIYGAQIDDELKGAPVKSFLAISNVFKIRTTKASQWANDILKKPFDFTIKEEVSFNGEKLSYPANEKEREDRWRKKLKYLSLERLVDLQGDKTSKTNTEPKANIDLEKLARTKTDTVINRLFRRYKAKFTDEDNFNIFVDAITMAMDPHTEFMAPVDKRTFDEEMSGSFFGIGAGLQEKDGSITITSLNSGSPAALSHVLAAGDIIAKVAENDGPDVDLEGYLIQDAIKLIRGKEGSIVKLTIKKPSGSMKVVKLKRSKIESDLDTYARSAIVRDEINKTKIGVILLPEFYTSFNDDPNGRKSYIDVANEVEKLKKEKVDGIVIDLRNNGGGSLFDVVQMVGLFVDKGPVVQVKDRNNKPIILEDKNDSVLYKGPLTVMVNEFSASSSEIFAAAIQDYGRGVIIGSTSTYGKGTVQRNIGLDSKRGISFDAADLGSVKLTLQKFYRISGGSTQLNGVASDIVLPNQIEVLKLRERDNKDALPYDEITKASYNLWNKPSLNINELKQLSNKRLATDSSFAIIKSNSAWLGAENDKSYSLNINEYKKQKKLVKAKFTQMETVQKLKNKMHISLLPSEAGKYAKDKAKVDFLNTWVDKMSEDIYLNQAVQVVGDITRIDVLPKSNNSQATTNQ